MQQEELFVQLAEGVIASDYALKNLNKALGEAQNEFGPAVKDETKTSGGYNYTPLSNIIGAVRPSIVKHHLTISQFPVSDLERKTMTVVTRLSHWDSGEWVQNSFELPGELAIGSGGALKFNQQTLGGAVTYGQKYAYKAIVGIADSEETVDSQKDETGSVPARARAQAKPAGKGKQQPAFAAQEPGMYDDPQSEVSQAPPPAKKESPVSRNSFFLKAKELGWGLDALKTLLKKKFGHFDTSKLSVEQMEEALKIMGTGEPDEVLANLDEPAEAA
jgi:hypothetical protein